MIRRLTDGPRRKGKFCGWRYDRGWNRTIGRITSLGSLADLGARRGFELALCNGRVTITSSRIPEYIGAFTRLIEMENKSAGRDQNLNPPKKKSSDSIVMDQF